MKFYLLEPEVAGNIADSIADWSMYPPLIEKLCYEFDDWFGTEILTSFAYFIVTDSLRLDLESIQASGCEFDAVEVTTSEIFEEFQSENLCKGLSCGESLPKFHWLKPIGILRQDDFAQAGIERGFKLSVSQRVWDVMQTHNMVRCSVEEM